MLLGWRRALRVRSVLIVLAGRQRDRIESIFRGIALMQSTKGASATTRFWAY